MMFRYLNMASIVIASSLSALCFTFSYKEPDILIPAGVINMFISNMSIFMYGYMKAADNFEKGIVG